VTGRNYAITEHVVLFVVAGSKKTTGYRRWFCENLRA
jgi:hypothetical protein